MILVRLTAQEVTGSIIGTVKDSGAHPSMVTVTITD